ncbi:MAG: BLUF domain-containing protein [Gemmatimonadaceae bacterium]|nr:BLUF domain-containing protein [Gemmatimonadaceae bacterium]
MSHEIRLLYASDAQAGLSYRDVLTIMEKAARANTTRGITGLLCYGFGQFLQVLEGERAMVNELYHHIVRDPRHAACQLLLVEDIAERDFPEWSMKVVNWSDAAASAQSASFAPSMMTGIEALDFLRRVAAAERELLE